MNIFVQASGKTRNLSFRGTAYELLSRLDINPETVIVTKNNSIITLDETLADSDEIKILSVVSGG